MGTIQADQAAIQAAKVNVAYSRITSPINGVVGLRQVDAGNIVHAADTNGLLVVTQLQPIAVIFTLPEDQLPTVLKGIRSGKKLVVEAFDRSETTHLASGSLLTVDNQIDPTTGTVKAKAVFDNADGALFPNQFVNIRLVLEQRANSLVVPAAAIQSGSVGSFVYVVRKCPDAGCPKAKDSSAGGAGAGKGGKGKGSGNATGTGGASAGGPSPDAQATGGPEGGGPGTPNGPGGAGDGGEGQQQKGPKYYVDVAPVVQDLTEGSQVILKSGVNAGDQVVIDGEEKLKKYSRVTPQQGTSNGGGPSTQQIGSDTAGGGGAAQPSSPDQGTPEAGAKAKSGSTRPNPGQGSPQ